MRVKKGEAVAINGIFAGEKREGGGGEKNSQLRVGEFREKRFS